MALEFISFRRILPISVIFFNFILVVISLVNLSKDFALESYVGASYLLCVTSMLNTLTISSITLAHISHAGWMSYELGFEFAWVTLFLLLQFIAATVVSADPTTLLCHSHTYSEISSHNLCPSHQATLAFAWTSFLILFTHLSLLAISLISICRTCDMSPLSVLTTPTAELPLCPSKQHFRDTEKGLSRTTSLASSTTSSFTSEAVYKNSRRKHRPAPLKLDKISVTSLPVYTTYAKAESKAAKKQAKEYQRSRTQMDLQPKVPNRHQLMAQISEQMLNGESDTTSSAEQWKKGHNASTSSLSNWTPPNDWQVSKENLKELPALPHAAVTFPPQREGVVDRTDLRDRRAPQPGEVLAEGGFWVTRQNVGNRI